MVAVVPAERAADALALLAERGVPAWELGRVRTAAGREVTLAGEYAGRAATWS
jgi:hypothetical protein